MSVTSQVSNIEIVSVDAFFGNQHMLCIDTVDASALDGTYLNFSSKTADYYVWFNGGGADPAPAGRTGVEVVIVGTENAIAVALLMETAIDSLVEFNAKALIGQARILIETKGLGAPLNAGADVDTTMTVIIQRAGSELALGFLDGDVELTLEEQLFDINSHQTGTQVIGSLRTGVNVGPISMSLKETTAAKLKELLEASAATEYTNGSGDVVTGIGSLAGSKQFTNTFTDAKMLVLHPTKNAPDDYSGDFAFWLAYPNLNALTFSGESNRMLTVDFQIFLDELRVNQVNQMTASLGQTGDWQSNLLKG